MQGFFRLGSLSLILFGPIPLFISCISFPFFSFFLSFVFLFFFFPSMHCEWVINRPKAGCKFSTIRFVLLLHCCLLIVRVLVTFIPNSLFFSLSLSSFPVVYPSNIFYKKDQILQLFFFLFLCSSMCDWPFDYENNNRRSEMDSMQMRAEIWWMPQLERPILYLLLFIYFDFHILQNVCVCGGLEALEELKWNSYIWRCPLSRSCHFWRNIDLASRSFV